MFTFSGVVEEEALEQLVLNRNLLCRVIRQDVFMAHVIQTWSTEKVLKESWKLYSDGQGRMGMWDTPGMAYRALLSSWLARNVTASVWDR